jgi:hypothetical protein
MALGGGARGSGSKDPLFVSVGAYGSSVCPTVPQCTCTERMYAMISMPATQDQGRVRYVPIITNISNQSDTLHTFLKNKIGYFRWVKIDDTFSSNIQNTQPSPPS